MPIPLIAALIALFGVLVSLLITLRTTNSFARAQLYLELRKRFSEVNKDLPRHRPDYHDETWTPIPEPDDKAKKDFKSLEAYWYHTFDEWYVTRKLLPSRFGLLCRTF